MARSLQNEVYCAICLDYSASHVSIECGHKFCGSCIFRWASRSSETSYCCPQCRGISEKRYLMVQILGVGRNHRLQRSTDSSPRSRKRRRTYGALAASQPGTLAGPVSALRPGPGLAPSGPMPSDRATAMPECPSELCLAGPLHEVKADLTDMLYWLIIKLELFMEIALGIWQPSP
ncbi:tripartite motif-containing protein 64-like [Tachyglossus aculeatus]|uniref:tripartite motif-containing protein 64-like n=1 Tax=Tachyglossus aculeatus TaxID=9261 RepID=UPI0018F61859|nr:tripartite motif-containing protein 64-like [Tachyglossus aculeatus]XP_038608690.1 tripartite motif-containing protein 64-like [Tachyglossus aculeatus]